MGDYDLTRLNFRDFEHMVQALGMEFVAKGMTPFADGPDGGRDATFEGKMLYPTATQPWNGYLVVQCKFRQKPSGVPAIEGQWVIQQIKTEIQKFSDLERGLREPEYYLFVTNVALTAYPTTGTKDLVKATLEEFVRKSSLKGYDLWSYDELCRFLDNSPSIRRAYSHFITSGDVLYEMHEALTERNQVMQTSGNDLDIIRSLEADLGMSLKNKRVKRQKIMSSSQSFRMNDNFEVEELVLGYLNLREIPEQVFEFRGLTHLVLCGNRISDIPPKISSLANLSYLRMECTRLSSLPNELQQLRNLKHLDLYENNFREFPAQVLEMEQLEYLCLSRNKINKIPSSIAKLTNLNYLGLANTGISRLPNEILEIGLEIRLDGYGWYDHIDVGENPLSVPPKEVVRRGLDAIREYFGRDR